MIKLVQESPDYRRSHGRPRHTAAHTLARYRTAFFEPLIATWRNFETWRIEGAKTATKRAEAVHDYVMRRAAAIGSGA